MRSFTALRSLCLFALRSLPFIFLTCVSSAGPVTYNPAFNHLRITCYLSLQCNKPIYHSIYTLIYFCSFLYQFLILLWNPLLLVYRFVPAARADLRSPIFIRLVPYAVRSPVGTGSDDVCMSLVMLRFRPPVRHYDPRRCLQPRPRLYNVLFAHLAADPGSLPDLEHVVVVANRKRLFACGLWC